MSLVIMVTAIVSIGAFLAALYALDVVRIAAGALATSRRAVAILQDPSLDDETREKEARSASLRLLKILVSIMFRGALAVVASFIPIWVADLSGLAATGEVIDFLSRWDVIVIATLVIIAFYFAWTRAWS